MLWFVTRYLQTPIHPKQFLDLCLHLSYNFVFFTKSISLTEPLAWLYALSLFLIQIFEKVKELVAASTFYSLAFHTINLSALSGCGVHILTYFMKLSFELAGRICIVMLEGSINMSL